MGESDEVLGLKRVEEYLTDCFFCGTCFGRGATHGGLHPASYDMGPDKRCPPREFFKFRAYSSMGYLRTAWSVSKGKVELTPEVASYFYTCVGCDNCTEVCKTTQSIEVQRGMREEIAARGLLPEPLKKLDQKIEKSHNVFGAKEKRDKWAEGLNLPRSGKVLYFAGCYAAYTHTDTAKATVAVLHSAGIDVAFLGEDEWHCGLVPAWDGSVSLLKEMAEHNVEAIKSSGAKIVVFSCPECYRTVRLDYPEIVGELPFETAHVAELFDKLVSEGHLKISEANRQKVTYHDPCHLGRHLRVFDEPRKVIQAVPETELVEMECSREWSWCCGLGSGVTKAVHPEFSKWSAGERIKEAKGVADILVTACARCISNLEPVAKKNDLKAVDLPVFVADAMGLSYKDAKETLAAPAPEIGLESILPDKSKDVEQMRLKMRLNRKNLDKILRERGLEVFKADPKATLAECGLAITDDQLGAINGILSTIKNPTVKHYANVVFAVVNPNFIF